LSSLDDHENSLGMELLSSTSKARKNTLALRRQLVQQSGGLKVLKDHYRRVRSPSTAGPSLRAPLSTLK
jgi:hypothetical protein